MIALITGGSGSGKSAFAEDLLLSVSEEKRIYLATMLPFGSEGEERIRRHRRQRAGKGFVTVECPRDIARADIPEGASVLLECVSNLAANEMFGTKPGEIPDPAGSERGVSRKICGDILRLSERARNLVLVTNEVFSEAAVYEGETEAYLRALGEINRYLASAADVVCEVVFGIPVVLKGALPR